MDCSKCNQLQHAPCMGYLYSSTIPKIFQCDNCSNIIHTPQDMFDWEANSIYRLAVAYAFFNNVFPSDVLAKLSEKNKVFVIKNLLQMNCIKPIDSGYSLDAQQLEAKVINKLFQRANQTLMPNSNSLLDHIPYDVDDSFYFSNPIKKSKIN